MLTAAERDAILASLVATGGAWDHLGLFLGTYVSAADHGLDTVLADLALPPGSLATAVVLGVWTAEALLTGGAAYVEAPAQHVRPASGAEATILGGWYLATLATGGGLRAWGAFDQPVSLADTTAQVTLIARGIVDPFGATRFEVTPLNG